MDFIKTVPYFGESAKGYIYLLAEEDLGYVKIGYTTNSEL